MSKISFGVTIESFRKHVQPSQSGQSATLGFADVTVTLGDAKLFTAKDIVVRRTSKDEVGLRAASQPYENRSGEKRSSAYYRFGDELYPGILAVVAAHDEVQAAFAESKTGAGASGGLTANVQIEIPA